MLNTTQTIRSRFSVTRVREDSREWCRINVELRDRDGVPELSITGEAGYMLTERQAKRSALEFWESYFEESPAEIFEMNRRFGRRFSSARGAARFVLETDGEFHGLDLDGEHNGLLLVVQSCGQIRDELREWFPEFVSLMRWHLNGMQSGCVHQALQGRSYKTDPGHKCPSCGTVLGAAWYRWPLPPRVLARVEELRTLAN